MSEPQLECPRCGSARISRHHAPVVEQEEGDVWAPRREEGYQCKACGLIESCFNDSDGYEAFRTRWHDPIEVLSAEAHQALIDERLREQDDAERAWTWPTEDPPGSGHHVTDRAQRATKLAEERAFSSYQIWATSEEGGQLPRYKFGFPVGEEHVVEVLRNPDDDAPRWAYARWLRSFESEAAQNSAAFVEWQVRLAASLRADPRADIKPDLPDGVFSSREPDRLDLPDQPWWRFPGHATDFREFVRESGLGESTRVLVTEGLIDRRLYFRGFVEHVAIKAHRFLEIADELYSLAPIRHLTITYCKGFDHMDEGLWKALLASPHLERIRSIKLPVRIFGQDNQYTELNRLTDRDIELLAASRHLRGLAHLDLEDESRLTEGAFDALAASTNLPDLSFVGHDLHEYSAGIASPWGPLGKPTRWLGDRPLHRYAPWLEARHRRRIAWLHPLESYGTETPDVEAVVEHPIARATGGRNAR